MQSGGVKKAPVRILVLISVQKCQYEQSQETCRRMCLGGCTCARVCACLHGPGAGVAVTLHGPRGMGRCGGETCDHRVKTFFNFFISFSKMPFGKHIAQYSGILGSQ